MTTHTTRRAGRAIALLTATALLSYGLSAFATQPAYAAVPLPTTSDPTTTSAEVKSCQPGPSGVAICLGAPANILQSRIPIDPADQAGVTALQTNARNLVVGIHDWDPTDRRISNWAQADIWGAMLAGLTGIIKKPANQRTSDERGAYHWFQQVVQQYRVKSAQNAQKEYQNWQSQQCAYKPGAPEPTYNPGVGCGGGTAGLVTGARTPTFEQLQSWGAYEAVQQLGLSASTAEAVGDGLAAGLTAGAIAAGTAIGITVGATASATTIGTIAGGSATYATVASGIGSSLAGAALGTIAIGVFAATVFVLAIVVLVVAIVQQVGYAQLPGKLQGAIDTAQNSLPDLNAMIGDTTTGGADMLGALFIGQTKIDSMASVLPSAYVQRQANWHGDLLQTQAADSSVSPPALSGPVVTSKAVSVKSWGDSWDAITRATPPGGSTPALTWLTDQGWFQQSFDGGSSWATKSRLRYLDWSGNKRTALIQGDHFIDIPSSGGVAGATAGNLCPDASACSMTSTLHMLDANGTPIAVTSAPSVTVPATISVTSGGSPFSEGQATTFTDPATDPRGGPVTYKWQFESRCFGLCIGSIDSAFHGNPVVTMTGQTVSYTWPSAGTFHMRHTVTNSAGSTVADRDITVAKGAPPSITLIKSKSALGPIFNGGSVTVTGCITTAGGTWVRPTFYVDWGDGHADSAQPPQIVFIINGVPQDSGPIAVQYGSAAGCATPWSYKASHVYTGADNQTFNVSVGVNDAEGDTASIINAATVKILPKDLAPTSFGFTNAPRTYHSSTFGDIPEIDEGQEADLEVEFNAPPDAYGESLDIDWDQGGVRTVFFKQCNLGGCTFPTSFTASTRFWSEPGTTGVTIYTVVASLHDVDGNTTRQMDIPIAVRNVSPTLSNLSITPAPGPQGGLLTLSGTVSSVDPFTPLGVKVTWPGSSDVLNLAGSLSQNFQVTHVLRDVGTHSVKVEVADDASGYDTEALNASITNVPPSPTVDPMAADEGSPVALTVLTGDPGYNDNFTETVDWGDGTTVDTVPYGTSSDGTLGSPLHTYASPGVYDVIVGVDDGHGGSGSTTTTVTVTNLKPVVTTQPGLATAGAVAELRGSFTDPGTGETYTGVVDWRDGSAPEPFAVATGTKDFALHHMYAHGGLYPVQVTVSDDNGGTSDLVTGEMAVVGPPGFTSNNPGDGTVGTPLTYQLASFGYPLPSFAVSWGELPLGLTLDADGLLSGTPLLEGIYRFKVNASNSEGSAESPPITMTIQPLPSAAGPAGGGPTSGASAPPSGNVLSVAGPTVSREFGTANGPLVPSYTGFATGDSEAGLGTAPTCTTTADAASPPGVYPVTCSGGVSSTYGFSYVAGQLTVTRATTTTTVRQTAGAAFGTRITLMATVTGAGAPTGTVQFATAVGKLGPPMPVTAGQAELTTRAVLTGREIVTATYSGDALRAPSLGRLRPRVTFDHTLLGPRTREVFLGSGTWLLNGMSLRAGLRIGPRASVVMLNTTVRGAVTATNPGAVIVCGSTLGSALTVYRATGFVLVGNPAELGCAANRVAGPVTITYAGSGVNLRGNRLSGNVRVDSTYAGGPFSAAPVISANTISGTLSCALNRPAPTNRGAPNTVTRRAGQCAGI